MATPRIPGATKARYQEKRDHIEELAGKDLTTEAIASRARCTNRHVSVTLRDEGWEPIEHGGPWRKKPKPNPTLATINTTR